MSDPPPSDPKPERSRPDEERAAAPAEDDTQGQELLDRLLFQAERPPKLAPAARRRIGEKLAAAERQRDADAAARREGSPPSRPSGMGRVLSLVWQRRRGLSTAASAIALAAAAVLVVVWMGHRTETTHRNDGVGPLSVRLADGSTAILDHGATIVEAERRTLRLEAGRVLLDVARSSQPLVVHARHGRVVALGTRLLVEDAATETRAAVVRGSARVEGRDGSQVLHAGEEGIVRAEGPPTRTPARRLSYLTSWAREALVHRADLLDEPIRRGTLVARAPGWDREWPLPMRELRVDVHVEDGVARTTIDQTFFNRINQRLEGRYSFPLPPDAAVSRLAMYVDGRLVEGGIVERQRGREIYESIVYLRRDPALLEWMAGNTFRIRIFPLEPRTEKRIILSYTQPLERLYDTYRLAVPIPELDEAVKRVSFRVRAKGDYQITSQSHAVDVVREGDSQVARFAAEDHLIGDDLVLALRHAEAPTAEVSRYVEGDQQYLLAHVTPDVRGAATPHRQRRWLVLVDTSASRSPLELRAQSFVLGRLVNELDEDDELDVVAFDTSARPWQQGWTAIRDVDRTTLEGFVEAELREPLGDTDLETALRAALERLEGATQPAGPGSADTARPTILYLGDGIATGGERELEPLRRLLSDRAAFVGIAIGDRVDATRLRSLAEATGGLFTQWSVSDDLGWKVFDLVAGLRTPRLLSLEARFEDERGQPIEQAQTHLSSRQLTGGEAATVVVRLAADVEPRKLVLEGTLAGAPWSRVVPIETEPTDARYLPRLWARRHIEALLQQDAAAHREEITKLGMDQFLVTPFTSLLVLETDAMYRQFKVSRPKDSRWAPYDAPATIEVKPEPVGTEPLALGAEGQAFILRSPLPIVQPPADPTTAYAALDSTLTLGNIGVIGASGSIGRRRAPRVRMGFSGLGLGGGGTGTGQGFGSGHGRLGRSHRGKGGADIAAGPPIVVTTATLRGRRSATDWMGTTRSRLPAALPTSAATPDVQDILVAPAATAEANVDRSELDATGPMTAATDLPPSDEVAGMPSGWLGSPVVHGAGQLSQRGLFDSRIDRWTVALQHNADPRLDDLSEFVPALFGDALDVDRDTLLAEAAGETVGSVTTEARELLERARHLLRPARYVLAPEGSASSSRITLNVASDGRFELERRTPTGLVERTVHRGDELISFYPELGLAAHRVTSPITPAWAARLAPFVLPSASALARGYDVTLSDERALRLTPLGKAGAAGSGVETIDIVLDADLRVAKVSRKRAGAAPTVTTLKYDGDRLVSLTADGLHFRVTREPSRDTAFDASVPERWVLIRLPLREPAYWQAEADEQAGGSQKWRTGQQQLLATYAALGDERQLWDVLGALREQAGSLWRGELALASRAVRLAADTKELDRILAGADEADPVAAYLRAAWHRQHDGRAKRDFAKLADDRPTGLVAMLSSYRALLADIDEDRERAAFERYQAFLSRGAYAPLQYAAAHRMTQQWQWSHTEAVLGLWDELADDPELGLLAQLAAANVALDRHYAKPELDPAGRYERAFEEAARRGQYPLVDRTVSRAFTRGAGGQARWRMFWVSWRTKLLASDDPQAWLALGQSMRHLGVVDEYGLLAAKVRDPSIDDPTAGAELARLLLQLGRPAAARALLADLLPGEGGEPGADAAELFALASTIAEQEGKLSEAARWLERSMGAMTEALSLTTVRALHHRLFDLSVRAARSAAAGGDLADPLRIAARWRKLDPDNPEIDKLCATLLYTAGKPAQARRHLLSIVDRHPAEGDAFAQVAEVLETQGRLEQAVAVWQRAFGAEPTNPTWLLREAQARVALGHPEAALPLLERITEGTWQERFDAVARQARELAKWAKR